MRTGKTISFKTSHRRIATFFSAQTFLQNSVGVDRLIDVTVRFDFLCSACVGVTPPHTVNCS